MLLSENSKTWLPNSIDHFQTTPHPPPPRPTHTHYTSHPHPLHNLPTHHPQHLFPNLLTINPPPNHLRLLVPPKPLPPDPLRPQIALVPIELYEISPTSSTNSNHLSQPPPFYPSPPKHSTETASPLHLPTQVPSTSLPTFPPTCIPSHPPTSPPATDSKPHTAHNPPPHHQHFRHAHM